MLRLLEACTFWKKYEYGINQLRPENMDTLTKVLNVQHDNQRPLFFIARK